MTLSDTVRITDTVCPQANFPVRVTFSLRSAERHHYLIIKKGRTGNFVQNLTRNTLLNFFFATAVAVEIRLTLKVTDLGKK